MKTARTTGLQPKNFGRVVLVAVALLTIPLVAMQFTDEVDWNLFDFIIMGTLMLLFGFSYELIASKVKTSSQQAVVAIVILAIFFLIWAELAVGIFSTPFAGN